MLLSHRKSYLFVTTVIEPFFSGFSADIEPTYPGHCPETKCYIYPRFCNSNNIRTATTTWYKNKEKTRKQQKNAKKFGYIKKKQYLCTRFQEKAAQMAESVDALDSNTSGAIRAGSTPALGTKWNIKGQAEDLKMTLSCSEQAECPESKRKGGVWNDRSTRERRREHRTRD